MEDAPMKLMAASPVVDRLARQLSGILDQYKDEEYQDEIFALLSQIAGCILYRISKCSKSHITPQTFPAVMQLNVERGFRSALAMCERKQKAN